MKKIDKTAKRIVDVFEEYLVKLNIHGFTIWPKIVEEIAGKDGGILAVDVALPYKQISFEITNRYIKLFEENEKEYSPFLLHEAFHVLLSRYTKIANDRFVSEREVEDEEETLVDELTHLFRQICK